ncbi:hypothetical protein FRC04_004949 [Tulasnella sp. 424]|nr:hypothetical protein FRC04_004949 [Tulasnella sp. 424]
MKKPSFSTTNSSNTDFSNSVSSASSASPYASNNLPPPLPLPTTPSARQLKHVTSTLASASSSSTCTSSSTSFSAAGVAVVALPVVVPPQQQQDRKSSHKLSLNFAGRRGNNNGGGALAGLGLPMGNGKTNNSSISSVDSGVSWGGAAAAAPGGGIDVSSKKAVRFSESEDGHTDSTTPLPLANSTPAVVVLDPARVVSSSVATTKRHGKTEARPQLVHLNSSSFADRTPKFLRR